MRQCICEGRMGTGEAVRDLRGIFRGNFSVEVGSCEIFGGSLLKLAGKKHKIHGIGIFTCMYHVSH